MAETIIACAQSKPAATTLTDMITVPASKAYVISTVTVCNVGSASDTFRISIGVNGEADTLYQYKMYNVQCDPGLPYMATVGWLLAAGDVMRVYSTNGDLSFSAERLEIT